MHVYYKAKVIKIKVFVHVFYLELKNIIIIISSIYLR